MPQTETAELILWGRATSGNVMKVLWLLEELTQARDREAGL